MRRSPLNNLDHRFLSLSTTLHSTDNQVSNLSLINILNAYLFRIANNFTNIYQIFSLSSLTKPLNFLQLYEFKEI